MAVSEKHTGLMTRAPEMLWFIATAMAGAALLAVSAKIQVPFWPVPMTFQTLVVLLLGTIVGLRRAMSTVTLYLSCGAAGLPVFAVAAVGPAALLGPTGGYLAGFLLAAFVTGILSDRGYGRSIWSRLVVLLIGVIAIYAPGLIWLGKMIGTEAALVHGLYPFLPAEGLKVTLAWLVLSAAKVKINPTL